MDRMTADPYQSLIEAVAERVKRAEVFEDVRCEAGALRCQARDVESEAFYQLLVEPAGERGGGGGGGAGVWIGLHTADRWLSESIEADLLHLGDKMEDLLEEELVELDYDGGALAIEHFRDDAKVYVFRSPLMIKGSDSPTDPGVIDRAVKILLAYEACFGQLGDMSASDELV
jgi:hypothetical protein